VIYKSFRSSSGQELVSIGLDRGKYGCDGIMDEEWSDHWFLLDGESVRFVGREMELVDVGDYDKDGTPEFLFWHSGYNQDGYVLYSDQFKQKTEYLWKYH